MMLIEGFEIAVVGLVKPNQQRHNLAQTQLTTTTTMPTPGRESVAKKGAFKGLAKVIDVAKQFSLKTIYSLLFNLDFIWSFT